MTAVGTADNDRARRGAAGPGRVGEELGTLHLTGCPRDPGSRSATFVVGSIIAIFEAFGLAVLAERCGRAVLFGGRLCRPSRADSIPPDPLADPREGMAWTDPDAEARTWALPLLTATGSW
jgi:hypothetical protein